MGFNSAFKGLMKLEFSRQISEKASTKKFLKNPFSANSWFFNNSTLCVISSESSCMCWIFKEVKEARTLKMHEINIKILLWGYYRFTKDNKKKYFFGVCKSVHHHTIKINQPTRRNSFTSLLLDFYVWLNMFREPLRPSSGATTALGASGFTVGALLVVVWQVMRNGVSKLTVAGDAERSE